MQPLILRDDGWLEPGPDVTHRPTPHLGHGRNACLAIVEHYTAGQDPMPAVWWLTNPNRTSGRSSAHFVVGPTGHVWQLASVYAVAWHAGVPTTRRGRRGMNSISIGVEHANAGLLIPGPEGWHEAYWRITEDGGRIVTGRPVPADEVVETGGHHWHVWAQPMLDRSEALHQVLLREIPSIVEIAYHDQIDPTWKVDPGPLFPRARFEALVPADRVIDDDTSTGQGRKTLMLGMRGREVLELRERLRRNGYVPGWSSVFDRQLHQVVRQFQTDRGLTVDGIVGPQTWGALLPWRHLGKPGIPLRIPLPT